MSRSTPFVAEGPGGADDNRRLKVNGSDELLVAGVFSGTVSPAGAAGGLRAEKVIVGDTPTLIKTSLATRDSMTARVWGAETVYIGGPTVTVAQGYPKMQYEEIMADAQSVAATEIWGICEPGKSCDVRVFELDA